MHVREGRVVGKEAGKLRAFKQGGLITLSREMIGNGRNPGNMIVRRKDFWVKRTGSRRIYVLSFIKEYHTCNNS